MQTKLRRAVFIYDALAGPFSGLLLLQLHRQVEELRSAQDIFVGRGYRNFSQPKEKKNGRIVGRSSLGRYLQKNVNFRLKMNKFFALNQWNEWIGFSFRNVSADFIQIQLLAWKH